ncbi:MAG: electron transport complex subunit E [Synergistes sp.]|nr:electron transport complex subunit E [Synergistes sp.]
MQNPLKLIKNGIFSENPTFVLVLGMCPTLAVTSSAMNGIGMGLAATAVLIGSNFAISALRKLIPDEIRIPAFIVVIAGFVTVVQLLISAYAPALDKALGIFIPLIVVNCIILARAEAFAFKSGVIDSVFDGLGMGLGFTAALTFIGAIREILGNGTLFGATVLSPSFYQPALMVILAPGGFITLGILMGVMRNRKIKREKALRGSAYPEYDGWKDLDACGGCALKGLCSGGNASVVCAKSAPAPSIPAPNTKEADK